jgi:hypothetical protein
VYAKQKSIAILNQFSIDEDEMEDLKSLISFNEIKIIVTYV